MISVITPAYNEEANLPILYDRLCAVFDCAGIEFEWIVVDDKSADSTFAVISELSEKDGRVKGLSFSRNFGSHQAIRCGLDHSTGEAAVVLAADLQDPPETIPALIERMDVGADIVWAVRAKREGEKKRTILLANTFYNFMRRVTNLDLPPSGADFFLLRRNVIEALGNCRENNVNILFLISWLGFRQDEIFYTKKARLHGETGWTFRKRIKLAIDSMISFSSLPLRCMSLLGLITSFTGFLYALYIIVDAYMGTPITGWPSIMVTILLAGGVLMMMSGVLGEYIWRILDEAKGRPSYIVARRSRQAVDDPPELIEK